MKILRIGIASYKDMKERTKAIARGDYKPGAHEPKIWFTSIDSFARLLSDSNRDLLKLIHEHQPESLTELAEISGREKSNLSRTLKTMSNYGLVTLKAGEGGRVVPRVPYKDIKVSLPVSAHQTA